MKFQGERSLRPIESAVVERLTAPDFSRTGYFPMLKSEKIRAARPAVFVGGSPSDNLQALHMGSGAVSGAGLSFLQSGAIAGHGYVLVDGFLLTNTGSHEVIAGFAEADGARDYRFIQDKSPIEADRPVLSIIGPGYQIWGHWLLDFLPRLALAQAVLGRDLDQCVIPMPSDTPVWARDMLRYFCGVTSSQIVFYDRHGEYLLAPVGLCVPDDLHTSYNLHSGLSDIYKPFIPSWLPDATPSRVCISRNRISQSQSVIRTFPKRAQFEDMARDRGFQIIHPQDLGIREQIAIFAGATTVVGEFGSGMHNTLFSKQDCVVGQFVMPSRIQSRIAGLRGHHSVFLLPDNSPRFDTADIAEMDVSIESMSQFFDEVELKEIAAPQSFDLE